MTFFRTSVSRTCRVLLISSVVLVEGAAHGACVAPPSDLVSWWSGDDHAYDLVGVNHATLRGGATYANGKVGRGFLFGGTTNSIQATTWGMNLGVLDFSIMGWEKTTSTKPFSALVEFEFHAPLLGVTGNGTLRLYPINVESAVGGFNDGQFHHFAITRRDGALSFYKDGVLAGTNIYTGTVVQNRFYIGTDTLPGDTFQGVIDEVAFFSRALSGAEIAAVAAATEGMCKPPLPLLSYFIEAEDFDYNNGRHLIEANAMPYLGGAYEGLAAVADYDYHDPGPNENAAYRSASQGVAISGSADRYRDIYEVETSHKVGWNEPGDWSRSTRFFSLHVWAWHVYARMSGGDSSIPNAIQVGEVVGTPGTINRNTVKLGEARGPSSGSWDYFYYVPVLDNSGQLATVYGGGTKAFRITILAGGQEDINYLQFVPVDAPSTGPCTASPPGLVAWWSGDGHPRDVQGTNHGTLRNGASYGASKVGEGFVFDGLNDYVETALDVQPSAMPTTTWECWVQPAVADPYRRQILSCDDGDYDRTLGIEAGQFSVFVGVGYWRPVPSSPNRWQHIAVVYSPDRVDFYKNGVRYSYNAAPTGGGTANRLNIGRNPGFGEYFQGRIDEVGIYNRALSSAEIQAIYKAGSAGRCKPVVCPEITFSPSTLPDGFAGTVYNQTLTANGAAAPYTIVQTGGSIPASLTLSSNGLLSGSLNSTGTFSFAVRVTDSNACSKSQNYSLTANLRPPPCGNLPAGLVSWWPAEGNAEDAVGLNGSVIVNGTGFAPGKVGQAFSFDGNNTNYIRVATNGLNVGANDFSVEGWLRTTATKDYSCILSFGSYHPALYLRGNGVLQVYPSSASAVGGFNDGIFHHFAAVRLNGTFTYYKDGVAAGTASSTVPLNEPNIFIGTSTYGGENFAGLIDELSFYNRALSANEVQTVFGRGSGGKCGTGACPTITPSPGTLPNGATGSPYQQTITAMGGAGPYTFTTTGALPPGLTLSSAGVLSGSPTASGSFSFLIMAADSANCTGSQSYTVSIQAPSQAVVLRGLEAVQVSQDWENSVPLIANKPTLIRAHLQLEAGSTQPVTVAGARLLGRNLANGATASWGAVNAPAGQVTVNRNDASLPSVREDVNNSLNFMLPPDWLTGQLELRLEWTGGLLVCREPAESSGMGTVNNCAILVSFTDMPVLPVKFIRVAWTDADGTHVPTPESIDEQKRRLLSIYPIASMASLENGFMTWSAADGARTDESRLLTLINDLRTTSGDTKTNSPIYYGVVSYGAAGNALTFRGLGFIGLGAAHGVISQGEFDSQRHIAAHEIGHTLNRHHAIFGGVGSCGEAGDNSAPEFPMDMTPQGRRPVLGLLNSGPEKQVWGFDHYSRKLINPYLQFDIMSYCFGGPEAPWPWMSKYTYTNLQNRIINVFGAGGAPGQFVPAGGGSYVLVRGEVNLGSGLVSWRPFYPFESVTPPPLPPPGDYTLVLQNQFGGSVMEIPFAIHVPPIEFDSIPTVASFSIVVPADPAIVRILLRRQGILQAQIQGSANAPTAQLLAPVGGEIFGNETISVRWSSSDLDLDARSYLVQFSPNAGATWQTIAIDWKTGTYDIPPDTLPATTQGRMRIIVSDGFRSDSDESSANFVIQNHSPTVAIREPGPGQVFSADQTIVMEAVANDLDDGPVIGPSVEWSSHLDGALGYGSMLLREASTLSEGQHTITVTATDSAGLNASAFVTIQVVREPQPILHIVRVAPQARLSWDAPATGYVLEVTSNLSPGNWTEVSEMPTLVGNQWVVTLPTTETSKFYRLVKR